MRVFSNVWLDAADIGRQFYWPTAKLHNSGGGLKPFFFFPFYLVWRIKMAGCIM